MTQEKDSPLLLNVWCQTGHNRVNSRVSSPVGLRCVPEVTLLQNVFSTFVTDQVTKEGLLSQSTRHRTA